jgi:opacity protein-like surface antigen
MKKFLIFAVLFVPAIVSAQHHSAAIKLGHFNPSATDGGFIVGYLGEKYIDRNFDIGWSVDWFHKNYVDQTLVAEFNDYYQIPRSEVNELRAKTNLHDIPLMFNMTAKLPVGPRIKAYITGGLGVEVLLIFYQNFQNPNEDEFKGAFDFSWRLGGGLAYELGRRSDLIAEITYHSSQPSWTYEVNDPQSGFKRIFERKFDMSGIMTRLGFKFYF